MSLITLEDGRQFPSYEGKPLSWSLNLYLTHSEEKQNYPKARAVLAEMDTAKIVHERKVTIRASFDRMFGHNAQKYLTLIQDELEKREDDALKDQQRQTMERNQARRSGGEETD